MQYEENKALDPASAVMPGLAPAIHVLLTAPKKKDVGARDKPGHDHRYI
jgi:hypothetical protein